MKTSDRWYRRGSPFVEISGRTYLNLAFGLPPLPKDIRLRVSELLPDVPADQLLVLRVLSNDEVQLLTQLLNNAMVEAWARICP